MDIGILNTAAASPMRGSTSRPGTASSVVDLDGRRWAGRWAVKPALRRVVVADDHDLVRLGFCQLLGRILPGAQIDEAENGEALEAALTGGVATDMLLVDLLMPCFDSERAVVALVERHPAMPVVVVSGSVDPACIARLLAAGVRGFMPKSLDGAQMVKALELVLAGGRYLPPDLLDCLVPGSPDTAESTAPRGVTPRQQDILELLLQGLPNKLIAARLHIAEATVKMHITALLRHYGVRSRAGLLAKLR
jgi:DNA-binding NarL/FixJ family response regulator